MSEVVLHPVVLVTGCTEGGIGWFMCREFATRGCRVFATARSVSSADGLEDLGITTLELDVTNQTSIKATVTEVVRQAGRIDVLVNNAGMSAVAPLAEVDLELAKKLYDTNVLGPLALIQEVVPHMARNKQGHVVNIGSVVGYVATPWSGVYCSSKAALHSLTDVLRLELKLLGIKVTLVAPGGITSNFGKNSQSNLKLKKPQESLYARWYPSIEKRAKYSQTPKSTPTAVFARRTVDAILQGNKPYFTFGYLSTVFVILKILPYWLKDMILVRLFKLQNAGDKVT